MYNFYNMIPERRSAWRSAQEIKIAAIEHEKRRFEILNEYAALMEPQVLGKVNRSSGWTAIFKTPLRLLAILIG